MRQLLAILLVMLIVALPETARATSAESAGFVLDPIELAAAERVALVDSATDEAPQLAEAYSSLYASREERRQNEGQALARGILGSFLGLLGGGLAAVITVGVGVVGVPVFVALGAAWGVEPFFEARYGWMFMGGLIGLCTAIPVEVGLVRLVAETEDPVVDGFAVLLGILVAVIGPGLGATIAGITDQDNLARTGAAWKLGLTTVKGPVRDGVGLELRF